MPATRTRLSLFRPSFFALALAAGGLLLAGCFGTDGGDKEDAAKIRQTLLDSGAVVFSSCAACHGTQGEGGRGPVLAYSDYVMNDTERLIRTVLNGLSSTDTIVVNGDTIVGGSMPFWRSDVLPPDEGGLSDFNIAAVLTYIRVVLNDSLVTDCAMDTTLFETVCTKVPRPQAEIDADYIPVARVTAVRDTLAPPSVPEF